MRLMLPYIISFQKYVLEVGWKALLRVLLRDQLEGISYYDAVPEACMDFTI